MSWKKRFFVTALLCATACGPDWGVPPSERAKTGSQKVSTVELCSEFEDIADQSEIARHVNFPHALPNIHVTPGQHPRNWIGTVREVFEPLGFHYLDGSERVGGVGIGKKLDEHQNLVLSLDVGSWSVSCTAIVYVTIGERYTPFSLPPSEEAAERSQYPIVDAATWQMMLENYAASVELIESRLSHCEMSTD